MMRNRPLSLPTLLASFALLQPCAHPKPSFTAIKGLLTDINSSYKDISPFWGMVLLENGMLYNYRFFGNYGTLTDDQKTALQNTANPDSYAIHHIHWLYLRPKAGIYDNVKNMPQDAIAALIQFLFVSPDDAILTANERDGDPIGEIGRALSQGTPQKSNALKAVRALADIISGLQGQPSQKDLEAAKEKVYNTLVEFHDTASPPSPGRRPPATGGGYRDSLKVSPNNGKNGWRYRAASFADIIVDAAAAQAGLADPAKPEAQLYPPHIVIRVLMAWFWRHINDREDVFVAFRDWYTDQAAGGVPSAQPQPSPEYDLADFEAFNAGQNRGAPSGMPDTEEGAERAAFYAAAGNLLDNLIPKPLGYAMVEVPPLHGQSAFTYPDCGETSLRNFFNIIWKYHKPDTFKDFTTKPVQDFYANDPEFKAAETMAIRKGWSDIVINLNAKVPDDIAADPGAVRYVSNSGARGAPTGANGGYAEIAAGLCNMLNVISRLVIDPKNILGAPWDMTSDDTKFAQAAGKLDRLCEIVTHEEFKLGWKEERSGVNKISSDYPTLVFTINGIRAFQWQFNPQHFEVSPLGNNSTNWLSKYRWGTLPQSYGIIRSWFVPFSSFTAKDTETLPNDLVFALPVGNNNLILEWIGDYILRHAKAGLYPILRARLEAMPQDANAQLKKLVLINEYTGQLLNPQANAGSLWWKNTYDSLRSNIRTLTGDNTDAVMTEVLARRYGNNLGDLGIDGNTEAWSLIRSFTAMTSLPYYDVIDQIPSAIRIHENIMSPEKNQRYSGHFEDFLGSLVGIMKSPYQQRRWLEYVAVKYPEVDLSIFWNIVHLQAFQWLSDHKANLDVTFFKSNPMTIIVRNTHMNVPQEKREALEKVKFLLDHGASLDYPALQQKFGTDPLKEALKLGDQEMVELFLSRNPKLTNPDYLSVDNPLRSIGIKNFEIMFDRLMEHNRKGIRAALFDNTTVRPFFLIWWSLVKNEPALAQKVLALMLEKQMPIHLSNSRKDDISNILHSLDSLMGIIKNESNVQAFPWQDLYKIISRRINRYHYSLAATELSTCQRIWEQVRDFTKDDPWYRSVNLLGDILRMATPQPTDSQQDKDTRENLLKEIDAKLQNDGQ